jgi:hypothetical protein
MILFNAHHEMEGGGTDIYRQEQNITSGATLTRTKGMMNVAKYLPTQINLLQLPYFVPI